MNYDTYRTIIWAAIISLITLFVIGAITVLETWDARKEAYSAALNAETKQALIIWHRYPDDLPPLETWLIVAYRDTKNGKEYVEHNKRYKTFWVLDRKEDMAMTHWAELPPYPGRK